MNDQSARDKLVSEIKKANNILIALSANPTIDELASAIALNLIFQKTNNHVITIFSGEVPNILNFLKPDAVFNKTISGLRDFIISLDPSKADYVRTKVVDGMVRVSITPSKAAVTIDDLEFSQGNYNVDLIIGLGVKDKEDLDKALQSHGKILHNAFVASITIGDEFSSLGALNWQEPNIKSYAQIVSDLGMHLEVKLDENNQPVAPVVIDPPTATALMTSLVFVTNRFSNNLTTPVVLSLAATLMEQGANQQLVVSELELANKKSSTNTDGSQLPKNDTTERASDIKTNVSVKNPLMSKDQMSATQSVSSDNLSNQNGAPLKGASQILPKVPAPPSIPILQPKPTTPQRESDDSTMAQSLPASKPPQLSHSQSPADLSKEPSFSKDSTRAHPSRPVVDIPPTPKTESSPLVAIPDMESATNKSKPPAPSMMPPIEGESWEKVNKFKQAFMDKIKENEKKTSADRQQLFNQSKDQEKQVQPSVEREDTGAKRQKKRPQKQKVIKPPIHHAETGPSLEEMIADELRADSVQDTMPYGASSASFNIPTPMDRQSPPSAPPAPPMPPMPPTFDPIAMTNLPPQQPFSDLSFNPAPPAPTPMPVPPAPPIPAPAPPTPNVIDENQFIIPE